MKIDNIELSCKNNFTGEITKIIVEDEKRDKANEEIVKKKYRAVSRDGDILESHGKQMRLEL